MQRSDSDPAAMREAAGYAAGYLRTGEPMPSELRAWLAGALQQVADGAAPAKAFGQRRGRRENPERIEWAADVRALVQSGSTPSAAIGEVADKHGVDDSSVRKAWQHWREGFDVPE